MSAEAAPPADAPPPAEARPPGLGLAGHDHWLQPYRGAAATLAGLQEAGFLGLRLDAPSLVDIDAWQTLPVVAAHAATYDQNNRRPVDEHTVVTAMDVGTGRLRWGMALSGEGRRRARRCEVTRAGTGVDVSLFQVDLRERLDLPWRSGEHLVMLVNGDQVSARVPVRLAPSPFGHQDPEVARFLAEARAKAPPSYDPASLADGKAANFAKGAGVPAPFTEGGLKAQLEPKETTRAGKALLRIGFNIPLAAKTPTPVDGGPDPTVPVEVLVVGEEYAAPFALSLQVPAQPARRDRRLVRGQLAVDLCASAALPSTPQRYHVHLFVGPFWMGPLTLTILPAPSPPPGGPG